MMNEFISQLAKRGFAKPTHYQLEITNIPSSMSSAEGVSDYLRDLKFGVVSAEIPGTQLLTQENRVYDMPAKFAYMKAHEELTITIRVDRDYLARKFFDAWEDSVYNRDTGNVFYKEQYVGQIKLSTMANDGTSKYAIQFEDCFPTQVGTIGYGWENTNQVLQFTVNFTFTRKKVTAGEALFTAGTGNAGDQGGSSNANDLEQSSLLSNITGDTTDLNFDVMGESMVSGFKDNISNSVSNLLQDGLNLRQFTAASPINPNIISKFF